MKDARAALRYAKAILNLAKDAKKDSAVNKDMQLIAVSYTHLTLPTIYSV